MNRSYSGKLPRPRGAAAPVNRQKILPNKISFHGVITYKCLIAAIFLGVWFAVEVFYPKPCLASTSIKRSFPELVERAEIIVVGTVTSIRNHWDEERKIPFTLVTFSDLTLLKGNTGSELTLHFLGGRTPEGKVYEVGGMPHFVVGEKVVVFSAGNQRDVMPLVGLWQGLLRVEVDSEGQGKTVSDHAHIPIIGIQDGLFLKHLSGSAGLKQQSLSLEALQNLIQQELNNSDE